MHQNKFTNALTKKITFRKLQILQKNEQVQWLKSKPANKKHVLFYKCAHLSKFVVTTTSMLYYINLLSELVQHISNIVNTRQLGRRQTIAQMCCLKRHNTTSKINVTNNLNLK